jgi:hypothetical protein
METNESVDPIELLCNRCGQTFSTFLHQMADQNVKVVCPNCRDGVDCQPAKDAKPVTASVPAHKPH